uniref:Uncharacterized protein LOC111101942 n=1 Tax=Crassostrea virginica TaxID=6565 RepID=A0A8B8AID4_CRAVI|nr:uncharacterized protein LOC111101942 [Crassostrea virginica]
MWPMGLFLIFTGTEICQQSPDDELISLVNSLILIITGFPPVTAIHIYNFIRFIKTFVHPPTAARSTSGGTIPLSTQNITSDLRGFEDLDAEQTILVETVFDHLSAEDKHLTINQFFQRFGRAPEVLEFFHFILTLEGNDQNGSPRKPLGELYFENKRNREARAKTLQEVDELQNHVQRQRQELLTSEQEKNQLEQENNQLEQENNQLEQENNQREQENNQLEQEKYQLEQENNQLKQHNLRQQYCNVILSAALAFVLVYFNFYS